MKLPTGWPLTRERDGVEYRNLFATSAIAGYGRGFQVLVEERSGAVVKLT